MIKKYYMGLCALLFSNIVSAGDLGVGTPTATQNFFIGIGGSYSSDNLNDQTLYGKGVNSAYTDGVLTSSGSAAGYSNPFYQNRNQFSPHVQVGYLRPFADGVNFWGIKFEYDYLNARFSDDNMTIAQAGSNYNYISHDTTDFTGNYAVESVQTSLNHEFLLLAMIGHSFNRSRIYLGAGPALLGMESNIYHLVGYADYNGNPGTDISGAPVNLSQSMWEWGGVAELGMTYSLTPSWFVDVNYSYTATAKDTVKFVSPFTNQIGPDNLVGTSYINSSQQVTVQSLKVSINKIF